MRAVALRRARPVTGPPTDRWHDCHTMQLDEPLGEVSDFANFSKPWILIAGLLAVFGGRRWPACRAHRPGGGRRGILVVNQPMKIGRRTPPPRPGWSRCPPAPMGAHADVDVVPLRTLRIRAAFAVAVGDVLPPLQPPLRAAASVVAFSR